MHYPAKTPGNAFKYSVVGRRYPEAATTSQKAETSPLTAKDCVDRRMESYPTGKSRTIQTVVTLLTEQSSTFAGFGSFSRLPISACSAVLGHASVQGKKLA
jgi:hypothetical protein